ncbi:hypothetical protein [Seohaeicola zhoushanensis]|uniref:Membrane protein n=1 Tax=Seohaeicola zhoushanensis TaxID=1569283 RepID=A0A8J3M5A7_9RHOB|nr:hypothetical protein [Seohaeicola zhoushanensis]GHF35729.1 membrane protein [Seohaeicola zhoushanensis]
MIGRIAGAALRGLLVALLVATPSLLLPGSITDASEMIALLAILAGALTFAEYNTEFPSFIEFRDAPPLNRLRFFCLLAMFLVLTTITRHTTDPSGLTAFLTGLGGLIGHLTDFPYSPVRLAILMLPTEAGVQTVDAVRIAAGVSYVIAMLTVIAFLISVRVMGWPTSSGAFNVWVNLPLFDPTTGGDVVHRLQRDGRINMIVGFLAPFFVPALIKLVSDNFEPLSMEDPKTRIWLLSAWAFLPASMMMRGLAMSRIAELIEEKRRRVYASAEAMQTA